MTIRLAPHAYNFKKCWLGIFSCYFVVKLVFYAAKISSYVPPDEITHLALSRIFTGFSLPENNSDTFQYGLVTNIPWLYYWFMGKLLPLNVLGLSDLFFLRLVNIVLALGTIYYTCRLARLLTHDNLTHMLLFLAMTNTLMFSFLSASVSYDNLANFFSAAGVYFLFAFFKERVGWVLGVSLVCQLAGCLTKASYLPLALILMILLIAHEYKSIPKLLQILPTKFKKVRISQLLLVAVVFFGVALNVQLYGNNYIQYGKMVPEMSDVLPVESVMQNRIAARELIFMQFKKGEISYWDAMRLASTIRHEGDRAGTIYLVRNYEERQRDRSELLGPLEYVLPWGERVLNSVYGILGHLSMYNVGKTLWPILCLYSLACFSVIFRSRSNSDNGFLFLLGVVTGSYFLFVMFFLNYQAYLFYENFDIGLQGRYVFPVIGPFYVLFSYYLMRLFKNKSAQIALFTCAAVVLILLDFPFFLYHVTPGWFSLE